MINWRSYRVKDEGEYLLILNMNVYLWVWVAVFHPDSRMRRRIALRDPWGYPGTPYLGISCIFTWDGAGLRGYIFWGPWRFFRKSVVPHFNGALSCSFTLRLSYQFFVSFSLLCPPASDWSPPIDAILYHFWRPSLEFGVFSPQLGASLASPYWGNLFYSHFNCGEVSARPKFPIGVPSPENFDAYAQIR